MESVIGCVRTMLRHNLANARLTLGDFLRAPSAVERVHFDALAKAASLRK